MASVWLETICDARDPKRDVEPQQWPAMASRCQLNWEAKRWKQLARLENGRVFLAVS